MEGQPFSVEELVEAATDINNYAANDAQAQAVANQVNRTIGGAATAIKCLISKLQMRQEVVTLQALNVVEVCVRNCGVNFHNEVGKYKFINELIKLLSSKYDGDITPQSVKERVISLMFSWYVGLPQQTKVGEAYKMLKQQGIIKRDPVDASRPDNQPPPPRQEENTAFNDQGNSQLLQTLLASKNPDDLHSANKLIKNMVKEEEERLDRVSKRIQTLETVTNNVKLLDDMIVKHQQDADTSSVELMTELYERCLTLRPELFRLASKNVDEKGADDAVGDILLASDELTRVIDLYKEKVLFKTGGDAASTSSSASVAASSQPETSDNSLCLLDLSLDSPSSAPPPPVVQNNTHVGVQSNAGGSLLDDQFKLLGLTGADDAPAPKPVPNPINPVGLPYSSQINTVQQQQPMMNMPPPPAYVNGVGSSLLDLQTMNGTNTFRMTMAPNQNPPPAATPANQNASLNPTNKTAPKQDLLNFDIFETDFLKGPSKPTTLPNLQPPNPPAAAAATSSPGVSLFEPLTLNSPLVAPPGGPVPALLNAPPPAPTIVPPPKPPLETNTTNIPSPSPANYLVPLESLKSGKYEPVPVLDKDGIKTFLLIAEDTRAEANPNVIVAILSTISLNTSQLTDFNVQVAVPKVMRVKLQPATSACLAPFNPLSAPPSISQVMLIANPSKEAVKLRFKITYTLGGVPHVETAHVDNVPVK